MFDNFFPGKSFPGPIPTSEGGLEFPVETDKGTSHDLDELSSGEKEVLFGYLRLRNSAPKYSIVLLDEPELHLNPRLIQGLPEFYHKHLGSELENQLWMVTHSDALLRQGVGKTDYSVFHLLPATTTAAGENQAKHLSANEELECAIIDLVGDLASYRPGAKVVVFEGAEDTEFDRDLVSSFFPDFTQTVNCISGGEKSRVKDLHDLLDKAIDAGNIPMKVYSIVDKDLEAKDALKEGRAFSWDVYHIENYLLSPEHIMLALEDIDCKGAFKNDADILEELRSCAHATLGRLIHHELGSYANKELVSAIQTKISPGSTEIGKDLFTVVQSSFNRIKSKLDESLAEERLEKMEVEITAKYTEQLENGEWLKGLRGRDILKEFVNRHLKGKIKYDAFRWLIANKMRAAGVRPEGMKQIINKINND